jgi:hypothetical protein
MGKIAITTNVSLDGVVQDPDGQEGFSRGGWFVQYGGKDLEEWGKVEYAEALPPRPCCWAGAATNGSGRAGHPGPASSRTG